MLNVAVIGFGWWGRHICNRLGGHGEITVACVAETQGSLHDEIRSKGLRVVSTYEEALADDTIDAVVLTTPHMFHEEQVLAAVKAGKHVFCEKPLGLTAESARRSVEACRSSGKVLGIGHERRFEPAMQRLKSMIDAGELGTIMHAEAAFNHDKLSTIPTGGWRTDKTLSPGAGMTGMGIHLTDLFLWMFGPVASVQAQTRDRVLGWPTGDMVVAQISFAAGMTASLSAILITPHYMRYQVFGSRAWVEIRNTTHPDTPGGTTLFTVARKGDEPVTEELPWTDTVSANLEAFADSVTGRRAYPWTDEELIGNVALYEAIVKSADTNQTVSLRELRH